MVQQNQNPTNGSLNLPHDLVIGNGLPGFILCNELWLLIDFLQVTRDFIKITTHLKMKLERNHTVNL